MIKQILIAPNAFKHSLSAIDAAQIIKSEIDSLKLDVKCELAPIADGGDGTIDVIHFYFKKSKYVECEVCDPLMRKIKAKWLLFDNETAIVELSKASGISLLNEKELNPMWANTYGTGELILSALNKGCRKIIIALGGSATVDAGLGLLTALGVKIYDNKKHKIKSGGGFLHSVCGIDLSSVDKRIKDVTFHVLCDVKSTLFGKTGTVNFSAQKGAKEGEMFILENGMKHFSSIVKKITGCEYEDEPMVGAAGGVAYSLKTFLHAELFGGFLYLSNLISLEEKIKNSDLIITGEGNLDLQTLMGKGVCELAKLAEKYQKKVVVFCGNYDSSVNWATYNVNQVIKIDSEGLSLGESLRKAKDLLEKIVKSNYKLFL